MTVPPPPAPPPSPASKYILGKWRYRISSMLGVFASIYVFFFSMKIQEFDWSNLDGFTIGKMIGALIIIWILSVAITSDSGLRFLISVTPSVFLWIFLVNPFVDGIHEGGGESMQMVFIICILITIAPAPIIYFILSRTSIFGHQCTHCEVRGKLRTHQIDKRFLGTETITNNEKREIHNKYLVTDETTCKNCGYSFTTTKETSEKAH